MMLKDKYFVKIWVVQMRKVTEQAKLINDKTIILKQMIDKIIIRISRKRDKVWIKSIKTVISCHMANKWMCWCRISSKQPSWTKIRQMPIMKALKWESWRLRDLTEVCLPFRSLKYHFMFLNNMTELKKLKIKDIKEGSNTLDWQLRKSMKKIWRCKLNTKWLRDSLASAESFLAGSKHSLLLWKINTS
jgi:hypothetical protein